jgi:hypothetical protein
VHIRRYLKTVNSLSFEAIPEYASLSEVLSTLNKPIIETIDSLREAVLFDLRQQGSESDKQKMKEFYGSLETRLKMKIMSQKKEE